MASDWQREWQTATLLRDLNRQMVATGTDTDPSSRWWRVRQGMRAFIADSSPQGGERVRRQMLHYLGTLPMVWNEHQYEQRMFAIRDMGIELVHADDICNGGFNEFCETFGLDTFDLEECECGEHNVCGEDGYTCEDDECGTCFPVKRVTVTVEVTFEVRNSASEYDTEYDVKRYLQLEVGGNVDDVDYDTVATDVVKVEATTA